MSMYFRFPRPSSDEFLQHSGYLRLLVPPSGHPTEKHCYAVIDLDQLELFMEHFGELGEIILEHEMPGKGTFSMQKDLPFRVITPRD
jgi:hypothetical protein